MPIESFLPSGSGEVANNRKLRQTNSPNFSKVSSITGTGLDDIAKTEDLEDDLLIANAVQEANIDFMALVNAREDRMGKMEAIQSKYSELFASMKRLELQHLKTTRGTEAILKNELGSRQNQKAIALNHQKIEALCRGLEKENRLVKEENKMLGQTERSRRDELCAKYESIICEIKSNMAGGGSGGGEDGDPLVFFPAFLADFQVQRQVFFFPRAV